MTSRSSLRGLIRRIILSPSAWIRFGRASLAHHRRSRAESATLNALAPAERAWLRQCFENGARTIYVRRMDSALGLEHADIVSISRVPELAPATVFAVTIQSWAWERILRHPEILRSPLT